MFFEPGAALLRAALRSIGRVEDFVVPGAYSFELTEAVVVVHMALARRFSPHDWAVDEITQHSCSGADGKA